MTRQIPARPHRRLRVWGAALALLALPVLAGCEEVPVEPAEAVGVTVEPTSGASPSATPSSEPTPEPTSSPQPSSTPAPTASTPEQAEAGTALAAVALLDVKGRAPKTGYDRDLFGSGWVDVDRNGCDTRNDVLARDLTAETFKPGTRDCVVLTGRLDDPFSGRAIAFERGDRTSSLVQIDHVVALSDAWQKGAQQWGDQRRVRFANDPLNLLAVDGSLNAQKGDGDAATWLPPNKAFRCGYVARQVAVKVGYGLWVTGAERDAMVRVLTSCPDEPLPTGGLTVLPDDGKQKAAPKPKTTEKPKPKPKKTEEPKPKPKPESVYYKNCTAAREAGAAPVRIGDPGYGTHLDRDRDGIGCE